jgi:hypothetical protein
MATSCTIQKHWLYSFENLTLCTSVLKPIHSLIVKLSQTVTMKILKFIQTNGYYLADLRRPIFYLKPGIHDTSFASKSPFKKTWIKKTWIQLCVYTMQEILMNTHKFWREIQQTKWHFWEERRVLPFVLHYYVQLYCEGD